MSKYLHPTVESKITDNSITFLTSDGTTQLFGAFTSDKGEDNVINMITSESEFLFEYGEPNMRKHGQSLYNILNWLSSGGGLYALRVMPDNAGYAHATLGVQTKVGTKKVKDSSGELVDFDDVSVKPIVSVSDVNNTSVEGLATELQRDRDITVDGYESHMLFTLYPKGRGKGYNDLGFKMYLEDSLKDTYDFNVYKLEITQVTESGSIKTIEGPYNVSLDPDAQSMSGESMFIKYVVEKYSKVIKVLFNEDAYDELGNIINPNVHPKKLDFITFDSMDQTYSDSTTGKNEDLLIAVKEYNDDGVEIGTNVIEKDNIEEFIVDSDNEFRNNTFESKEESIDNAKVALSKIKSDSYPTLTSDLMNTTDGTLYDEHESLTNDTDSISVDYDSNKSSYESDTSDATAIKTSINAVESSVKGLIPLFNEIKDYTSAVEELADTISLENSINSMRSILTVYNINELKINKHRDEVDEAINSYQNALTTYGDDVTSTSLVTEIFDFVNEADSAVDFLNIVSDDTLTYADTDISTLETAVSTMKTEYDKLIDTYTLESDKTTALSNLKTSATNFIDNVDIAFEEVEVELGVDVCDSLLIEVDDAMTYANAISSSAESTVSSGSVPELTETVEENILDMETELISLKANTAEFILKDLTSNIFVREGSDGDLDGSNFSLREETKEKLLTRAYTGLIDDDLLNKKLLPIDMVLDANYSEPIKNSIAELVTEIRRDFMGILDTGFQASAQQSVQYRQDKLQVNDFRLAIYTQDLIVHDAEFTGNDMKVTPTYYLASKMPVHDDSYGIQYPLAGNRRGTISGFKKLSYNPNKPWKTQLYKNQINYLESDHRRTRFGTQLTSQKVTSALSNINNVRVILKIQRDVELMMEDFQFEFNNPQTWGIAQSNLSGYLQKWITNNACSSISGTVYASEYDKQQKQVRVKIEMQFTSIIESVLIDLVVNK